MKCERATARRAHVNALECTRVRRPVEGSVLVFGLAERSLAEFPEASFDGRGRRVMFAFVGVCRQLQLAFVSSYRTSTWLRTASARQVSRPGTELAEHGISMRVPDVCAVCIMCLLLEFILQGT